MVNLQGKKTTTSREIKDALSSNLNINASDSRFKTIIDKIADSRYRIKDLSTINNAVSSAIFRIIDGKIFTCSSSSGIVKVYDCEFDVLLKTINTNGSRATYGITFDATNIYIAKTTTEGTKIYWYIQKYHRFTLEFISETLIKENTGTLSTAVQIMGLVENGDYLYAACHEVDSGVNTNKIRKILKSDLSTVAFANFGTPLNVVKGVNGIYAMGANTSPLINRVNFYDFDLNLIQTFPQTTISAQLFRIGIEFGNYFYACNDAGIIIKYNIATNTIVAEVDTNESAAIRQVFLINNNTNLIIQSNTGKIKLYDLDLNLIKIWDYYNTSTSGSVFCIDNNNMIWTQSASKQTTIYKKQFIDMTKNIT